MRMALRTFVTGCSMAAIDSTAAASIRTEKLKKIVFSFSTTCDGPHRANHGCDIGAVRAGGGACTAA
jgi:hypothetical protein